jgi:hypothetical protein
MKLRMTLPAVSVSALAMLAGTATPLAAACPTPAADRTSALITVTLTPKSDGTGCVVAAIKPETLVSVVPGDVIKWTFDNRCNRNMNMKIGHRRPKRPDVGNPNFPRNEDFVANQNGRHIIADPSPIPANKTGTVCVVARSANPRIYKYNISGDASEDPEVEIQPPPPPPNR